MNLLGQLKLTHENQLLLFYLAGHIFQQSQFFLSFKPLDKYEAMLLHLKNPKTLKIAYEFLVPNVLICHKANILLLFL